MLIAGFDSSRRTAPPDNSDSSAEWEHGKTDVANEDPVGEDVFEEDGTGETIAEEDEAKPKNRLPLLAGIGKPKASTLATYPKA